jgi:hypothetical protein
MKYLCLAYHRIGFRDDFIEDAVDYRDELRRSGHYIASSPLQSAEAVMTIRVRNGKMSITDGPYADAKEQLGAFYLIEAIDLNEAVRVASKLPSAQIGCVEVRPLVEFEFERAMWDCRLDVIDATSCVGTVS